MSITDRIAAAMTQAKAANAEAQRQKEQRQPTVASDPLQVTPTGRRSTQTPGGVITAGSTDLGAVVDDTNLTAAGGYPPDNEPNLGVGEGMSPAGHPAGDDTMIMPTKVRRYQNVRQDAADKVSMFTVKLDIAAPPVKLVGYAADGQINRITVTIPSNLAVAVGIADRADKLGAAGVTSMGASGSVWQNAFMIPSPTGGVGNTEPFTLSTRGELWAQVISATGWISVLVEQFYADD